LEGDLRTRLDGDRHLIHFTSLGERQLMRTWQALVSASYLSRRQRPTSGEELFLMCQRAGLDHANVVLTMASACDDEGRGTIETLVGRPISSWIVPGAPPPPKPVARGVAVQRARAEDSWVVVSVRSNPKKEGSASYDRYAKWQTGATVAEMLAAGLTRGDVGWDTHPDRAFVVISPPSAAVPA
jgi:hypothetical protein